MLNRKKYQASKLEMQFHMISLIYTELPMHARTGNTTFMQRWLYIDELRTALDIFCFAVFLIIEVIEADELKEVTVSTAAQI